MLTFSCHRLNPKRTPKIPREIVVGDDHARLDHDLAHRHVQSLDDAPDILQLGLGALHQEGIGALVGGDFAALGEQLVLLHFKSAVSSSALA